MKTVSSLTLALMLFVSVPSFALELHYIGPDGFLGSFGKGISLVKGATVTGSQAISLIDKGVFDGYFQYSDGTPLHRTKWYLETRFKQTRYTVEPYGPGRGGTAGNTHINSLVAPLALAVGVAGLATSESVSASTVRQNAAAPAPVKVDGSNVGSGSEIDALLSRAAPAQNTRGSGTTR